MSCEINQLTETSESIEQANTYNVLCEKRLVVCLKNMCPHNHGENNFETFDELLNTNCIYKIVQMVSKQHFSMKVSSQEFLSNLITYFYHTFGVYIRPILSGRQWKRKMILFLLYACVHSEQKLYFVQKIMSFSSQIQDQLVNEFERLQSEMKQDRKQNKWSQIIKMLETQNNEIKKLLIQSKQIQQNNILEIKKLYEELQQSKIEINALTFEKRKILNKFKLSNLSEYEDLCLKLTYENQVLLQREEQLLQNIQELQEQMELLKKGIHKTDQVVVELNMKNSMLLKNRQELARQVSIYHENQLNLTRQWGKEDKEEVITRDGSPMEQRMSLRVSSILKPDIFACSNFSNFSRKSKRQSRTSAWVEKDNEILTLSQKVQSSQEEIQQLKYKIMDLEDEIQKLQSREKFSLKKIRKIQKLKDEFHEEYLCHKSSEK